MFIRTYINLMIKDILTGLRETYSCEGAKFIAAKMLETIFLF